MADSEGVRLQKVLSQAGIASRRVAEKMIIDGRVEVDDRVVTELGTRVDPKGSVIRVDGARVTVDDTLVHLAINKPKGMHSTMSDDRGRPCVGDLVEHRVRGNKKLFHVGRVAALADASVVRRAQDVLGDSGRQRAPRAGSQTARWNRTGRRPRAFG